MDELEAVSLVDLSSLLGSKDTKGLSLSLSSEARSD